MFARATGSIVKGTQMDGTDELVGYLNEEIKLDLVAYSEQKSVGSDHQIYLLTSVFKKYFELGLIYWRRGDMQLSAESFSSCVEKYHRMIVDAGSFGAKDGFWQNFWEGSCRDEALPAAAAYLNGVEFTLAATPHGISRFEHEGYRPWFSSKLILACMGHASISRDELNRSISLARQNRSYSANLINLTEFHFEVLTGKWADRASSEMLDRHSELYTGIKKIKGPPDLIHGEGIHKDRVVDWIFVCILKRIGWSGRYLHSWPKDSELTEPDPIDAAKARETHIAPTQYVTLD
jgi:hypothetical protein